MQDFILKTTFIIVLIVCRYINRMRKIRMINIKFVFLQVQTNAKCYVK